jgi:hypothetical protein
MKLYTVAEIKELDDKTPITSVKGTLIEVWPFKPFTYKSGPRKGEKGSCQNLRLEDSTGNIMVKNWGEPLPLSDRGETFLFESHEGKKGWSGLSKGTDDYEGKISHTISMSENAKIKNPDGSFASSGKTEKSSTTTAAPVRDPYILALEAQAACKVASLGALKLAEELKEEFVAATGNPPSAEQIQSWQGQINLYLRDKGAPQALYSSAKPAAPEKAKEDDFPFPE